MGVNDGLKEGAQVLQAAIEYHDRLAKPQDAVQVLYKRFQKHPKHCSRLMGIRQPVCRVC
jgi:hypothetical protein